MVDPGMMGISDTPLNRFMPGNMVEVIAGVSGFCRVLKSLDGAGSAGRDGGFGM